MLVINSPPRVLSKHHFGTIKVDFFVILVKVFVSPEDLTLFLLGNECQKRY